MRLALRWIGSAAALLLVAHLVPGIVVDSFGAAFVGALVLGLVNAFVRPIAKLLTLPLTLLTLGLFALVVNAAMFGLAVWIVPGVEADGPVAVFLGALLYGLLAWAIVGLLGGRRKR